MAGRRTFRILTCSQHSGILCKKQQFTHSTTNIHKITTHTRKLQQYTLPTNNNYTQDNLKLATIYPKQINTRDKSKNSSIHELYIYINIYIYTYIYIHIYTQIVFLTPMHLRQVYVRINSHLIYFCLRTTHAQRMQAPWRRIVAMETDSSQPKFPSLCLSRSLSVSLSLSLALSCPSCPDFPPDRTWPVYDSQLILVLCMNGQVGPKSR